MRPTQKQNRSRGRGNRKPNGNNLNRVYESAGPEGKVRGTPQQIFDKYLMLARDAQTSGDRVVAENFLQHAEHYQRILLESMGPRPERRDHLSEQDQPDLDDQDDDGDQDGDGDLEMASQPESDRRDDYRREDNRREDNRRDDNRRDDSRRDDSNRPRREPRSSQAARQPAPQPEVSGLTTIDSGDSGNLLVEAEDLSSSQPRRRRRPEPAAAEPAPAIAPVEADVQTD